MPNIEKTSARAATAKRASTFTESVIREMTRIANQYGAINLAQGFPDFPMPDPMKDAACAAIHGDINQYAITWGSPALRLAIAEKYRNWYGMTVDPEREITVCCGATKQWRRRSCADRSRRRSDHLEPYYAEYGPDAILAGARGVRAVEARLKLDLTVASCVLEQDSRVVVNTPPIRPAGLTREEIS